MKNYSYQRILHILQKDFHLSLMKCDDIEHRDTYNVISPIGHVLWENVSLDSLRIALTRFDYPTEE